jgi:NRPS condensation-like uncharacterized protein
MCTPLTFLEELWQQRNPPDETSNIQLELRVSGTLDECRLREAVAAAAAAHPMTRARNTARRWLTRPPLWELGQPTVGGVVRAIDCADGSEMDVARDDFYSRGIGLGEAPALRLLLAHRPCGDSLLLKLHHAITDGVGALRFLHSVARSYEGRPDPVPPVDPMVARDLKSHFRRAPSAPSPTVEPPGRPVEPPAFIVAEGASSRPAYGFHHEVLSAEETRRLEPRRLEPNATVNDLLIAALTLAVASWNASRDMPCECIAVFMPVNARPPEWRDEVVANVTLGSEVTTTSGQRATDVALMEAVAAQTRWIKSGIGYERLFGLPRWFLNLFPIWMPMLCRLRGYQVDPSTVLSNLGRVADVPDFGPTAGAATEFWFSPPIGMPTGLAVGAASLHGRLHLVVRYCRALFDQGAVRCFSSLFLESLMDLSGGPTSRESPGDEGAMTPRLTLESPR